MRDRKLRDQDHGSEADKKEKSCRCPRPSCKKSDEKSTSGDHEVRAYETGSGGLCPRKLEGADKRGGIEHERAKREDAQEQGADQKKCPATAANLGALGGKPGGERLQQHKQEGERAEREGLARENQTAQNDGQESENVEKERQG
ncbi:hypothetical protein [Bradyrhizobium sp. BRP22]|uniref:hypothetical protein n=1 Tax=Bradyrhizobium sp. BRP22 TaxID=2793821 RepID=UPI001CD5417C|nr:hypothetical protein [Bradyrhizobium sp. BRP22]